MSPLHVSAFHVQESQDDHSSSLLQATIRRKADHNAYHNTRSFPYDNIPSSEEILVFEEYESQETVSGLPEAEERATPQAIMIDKAIFQQLVE